jgi:hypothetical protein
LATRFKGPVKNKDMADVGSNTDARRWFSNLPIGQDPDYITYMNDFLVEQDYAAADWVITTTEAGAGNATEALAGDELNGALLITNDDADNDLDSLQHTQEVWKMASGKRLWFKTRVKINDADQVDEFIGLCVTDTTPLVATDRAGFGIADGDASINVLSEKDSTETSTDSGVDAADATYVELAMYWDGISKLMYFIDGNLVATHTTNVPNDENLCITFHHQNGEAAAQTLHIDYVYVCMER